MLKSHPKAFLSAAALLTASLVAPLHGESVPPAEARPYATRDGLGNVLRKLEAGETVKIAYLGGSITEAGGWRVTSLNWFKERFPEAQVEQVFACFGGTGSDLGVFRMDHDVLPHRPDLLFVEFAVNDRHLSHHEVLRGMEGIVRKAWQAQPRMDICFVYAYRVGIEQEFIDHGLCPKTQTAMEMLAGHYGVSSVNFALRAAQEEHAGRTLCKPASIGFIGKQMPNRHRGMNDWLLEYAVTDAGRTAERGYVPHAVGRLQFVVGGRRGGRLFAQDAITLETGVWQHVAVTRRGDRFTLYVNGRETATQTAKVQIPHSDAPLFLGIPHPIKAVINGLVHGYRGHMDEVLILKQALSPEETAALAQGTLPEAVEPALYLKLDDQEGMRAADASAHARHGTLRQFGDALEARPAGSWWSDDKPTALTGGSLRFTGGHDKSGAADSVVISKTEGLNLAGDFTLALWLRPDSLHTEETLFSYDGVHPIGPGHGIYLDALSESLEKIWREQPQPTDHAPKLASPYIDDHLGHARMVPVTKEMLEGSWAALNENNFLIQRWGHLMTPVVWHSEQGGDSIRFTFKGSTAYVWGGGVMDAGRLAVFLDGKKVGEANFCHRFAGANPRPSRPLLVKGLDPDATHSIELKIMDTPDRKPLTHRTRKTESELLADPAYQGNHVMISHLLLLGELVD